MKKRIQQDKIHYLEQVPPIFMNVMKMENGMKFKKLSLLIEKKKRFSGEKYVLVGTTSKDGFDSNGEIIINGRAVYVFEMDSIGEWKESKKVVASEKDSYAYFGTAIAIQDSILLIGADWESEDQNEENYLFRSGSVYSYTLSETSSFSTIDDNNQINIYPNPTSGIINIEFNNRRTNSIIIRNLLGQVIFHEIDKFDSDVQLNIESPPGLYIIEVRTKEGDSFSTKFYKN